jgi:hypothetical protein
MYEYKGILLERDEKSSIIEKFIEQFVDKDFPKRILISNHLKYKDQILAMDNIRSVRVPDVDNLYLYHERLKEMYKTNFDSFCTYVEQLEPWEDVDLLVFDQSFTWYICITHNDSVILFGLS